MFKFLRVVVLWALGAGLFVTCVLFLWQAYGVVQTGVPLSALPLEEVAWGLLDHQDYLVYGTLVGASLGLLSMIPAVIRENAEKLLYWSLFGAFSGTVTVVCVMFLYNAYKLANSGVAANEVPFIRLVTEVMQLQEFAPYGAIAGAVSALVWVIVSLLRRLEVPTSAPAGFPGQLDDPDSMIRSQRARRAREYMASRDHLDPDLGQL